MTANKLTIADINKFGRGELFSPELRNAICNAAIASIEGEEYSYGTDIDQLRRNLKSRDEFIVAKGLWCEFTEQLPTPPVASPSGEGERHSEYELTPTELMWVDIQKRDTNFAWRAGDAEQRVDVSKDAVEAVLSNAAVRIASLEYADAEGDKVIALAEADNAALRARVEQLEAGLKMIAQDYTRESECKSIARAALAKREG